MTALINAEFVHIIRRQALMGRAVVRTTNPLLGRGSVPVNILLDVLAERGCVGFGEGRGVLGG